MSTVGLFLPETSIKTESTVGRITSSVDLHKQKGFLSDLSSTTVSKMIYGSYFIGKDELT